MPTLCIFQIKAGKTVDLIVPEYDGAKVNSYRFRVGEQEYNLYAKPNPSHPPSWESFFPAEVPRDILGESASSGAVLLTTVEDRRYALTFGTGRYLLREDCYEERFGLRIVLNSVESVRSIDKDSFDAINGKTRTQASKDSPMGLFGFDVERDLLKVVTGTPPASLDLGDRLTGMDAIYVLSGTTIDRLPDLLRRLNYQSRLETYKDGQFAFVDNIRPISESEKIETLDAVLFEMLQEPPENRAAGLDFILPGIVDFKEIQYFAYHDYVRSPSRYHDIGINSFLDAARANNWPLDTGSLRQRPIFSVDANDEFHKLATAYRCILGEFSHEGTKYILSEGKWYAIADSFLDGVNDFVRDQPRYDGLPVYAEGITESKYEEKDYNRDVAANGTGFLNFDRKLLRPESNQEFEFCDLYTEKDGFKDIIHVKIGKSSSALSHLFSQGTVSAETFKMFADCRRQLNDHLLPAHMRLADPNAELNLPEYRIVFAVVRKAGSGLPFFARVNLRQAFRAIKNWGFTPYLAEIPMDPVWSAIRNVDKKARKAARNAAASEG